MAVGLPGIFKHFISEETSGKAHIKKQVIN